jgi:hypothetical protein
MVWFDYAVLSIVLVESSSISTLAIAAFFLVQFNRSEKVDTK